MASGTLSQNRIAVVICAHTEDRWPTLTAALSQVGRQRRDGDQVVLVVDGNQALLERARRDLPEDVLVVPNVERRGLSGARNSGVQATRVELVAFLDDDAVPRPDWLDALRERFADPAVMMVGGAVEPRWERGAAPAWFPDEFGWVVGCDYRGMPGDGAAIRNPIGANMAVRRSSLAAAGGFSPELGRVGADTAGAEETEMGIRISSAQPGARIVRDTSAVVDHHVPATRSTVGYFTTRCWSEGRSKARLAASVGAGSALSVETGHAARLVSTSLLRYLGQAVTGDPAALLRGFWTLAGLAVTTAGFARGRLGGRPPASAGPAGRALDEAPVPADSAPAFEPIPVGELDLLRPGPDPKLNGRGQAHLLVRAHGWPVGQALLDGLTEGAGRDEWLAAARTALGADLPEADRLAAARPADPDPGPGPMTVVVPTTGCNPLLPVTVRALLDQRGVADVVVVANGPARAGAAELLSTVDSTRLRILDVPLPGASRARNHGWRAAGTPLVGFTDDDAVPEPGWAARLAMPFAVSEEVSCVTGVVVPAALDSHAQLRFEQYGAFATGFDLTVWHPGPGADRLLSALTADASRAGAPYRAVPGKRGAAFPYTAGEYGSGVAAFRTDALAQVGGFDEALGPGTPALAGEDLDVCRRIYLAGGSIVCQPGAVVRHHHRTTEADLQAQVFGYGVGLTAAVTSLLVREPRHVVGFARRVPAALRMLLSPASEKNLALPDDFPRELLVRERRGILVGPWRYLRARGSSRREATR